MEDVTSVAFSWEACARRSAGEWGPVGGNPGGALDGFAVSVGYEEFPGLKIYCPFRRLEGRRLAVNFASPYSALGPASGPEQAECGQRG